jgi:hypothetical protein
MEAVGTVVTVVAIAVALLIRRGAARVGEEVPEVADTNIAEPRAVAARLSVGGPATEFR